MRSFYWEIIAFAVSICSNTTLFKKRKSVILANVHISIYIEYVLCFKMLKHFYIFSFYNVLMP